MKCRGVRNPSACLRCKYDDCIVDENGNLPQDVADRIMKNRQSCKEYYQRHREELLAKHNEPEAKAKRREEARRWRENNHERMLEQLRTYHKRHKAELKVKHAEYYQAHREEICARMRENYWRKKGMSKDEANDIAQERDCPSCVWRSEQGCTVWQCDYLSRTELHEILRRSPEVRGKK